LHKLLIYIMLYCMSKISKNGLKKALEICVKIQKSLFLNISQSVNYVFSLLKAIIPSLRICYPQRNSIGICNSEQ